MTDRDGWIWSDEDQRWTNEYWARTTGVRAGWLAPDPSAGSRDRPEEDSGAADA